MKHIAWDSVEEMLVSENLSALTGQPISSVEVKAGDFGGFSGSHLSSVETNGGTGPHYVLKRTINAKDWVIRTTNDGAGREVRLWEYGVMGKLQTVVEHPIIACAWSDSGWAVLMHDISDSIMPVKSRINVVQNRICLEGLADMHAKFWQDSSLQNSDLGLSDLHACLSLMTPRRSRPEQGLHPIVDAFLDGWDRLDLVIEPDIAAVVHQWLEDPQPLVDALRPYPQTLVHGDCWRGNVGIQQEPPAKLILFDWQIATLAPPAIDLIWWLAANTGYLPVTFDEVIDIYKQALIRRLGAAFSEDWWQAQLDLSLCAGFLRVGWAFASRLLNDDFDFTRAEWQQALAWRSDRVRVGLKRLYA